MRDPIEVVMARLEAQTHRRFIKAHLPLDCLPLYEGVKYLHVARDGRDTCMSWHNHQLAYTPEILARFDRIGLEDATIGRPYPRPSADPRAFFHGWITQGTDGSFLDFFDFEVTYWTERHRETVLLVHYNDLKADLADEMHRIAEFLNIDIPAASWPDIVEAAGFASMRRDGQRLLPDAGASFDGGAQRFLFKGTNDRWRAVVDADDLALYATKVEERFSPSCARWMESGRLVAGDPRSNH
jgi:aryl sulfotransferase